MNKLDRFHFTGSVKYMKEVSNLIANTSYVEIYLNVVCKRGEEQWT